MKNLENLNEINIELEKITKICLREIKERESNRNNNNAELKKYIKEKILGVDLNENK